jgi:hypothetical protein
MRRHKAAIDITTHFVIPKAGIQSCPPPEIVITGLDPVIHAFFVANPSGCRVDGRIKSGHDD